MGYNKNAVLAVWNGYDDNRKLESGDTGSHKNIWIDTMEQYNKDIEDDAWYEIPDNVVGVVVNPITGKIATDKDEKKKLFYFLRGTEPVNDYNYDFEAVFKEDNDIKGEVKIEN